MDCPGSDVYRELQYINNIKSLRYLPTFEELEKLVVIAVIFDYDIASDIMQYGDIDKWRTSLDVLRGRSANIKYKELVQMAESLGRRKRKASTKHPMYETDLPGRPALSIPSKNGTVPRFTARSIINDLERDIDELEKQLSRSSGRSGNG